MKYTAKITLAALLVVSPLTKAEIPEGLAEAMAVCYGIYKASGEYFGEVMPQMAETFKGTANGAAVVGTFLLMGEDRNEGKELRSMGEYEKIFDGMGYGSYQKTMGYFEMWKMGGEQAWAKQMEECIPINEYQAKVIQSMRKNGLFQGTE